MRGPNIAVLLLLIVAIIIAVLYQRGSASNDIFVSNGGGTGLRVLPGYALSACKDTDTDKSYVDPQTLMAAGGSPGVAGYTWSTDFSTFPPGTTVNPLTGIFHSSGGSVIPGSYTIKVKVSDGTSTASGTVSLGVMAVSSAPVNGIPNPSCPFAILQQYPAAWFPLDDATADKPYGASIFVLGGTPPYTWSEDTTFTERSDFDVSGLTIDSAKGIVRGTPLESVSGKTLQFRVIVKDKAGDTIGGPVYTIKVK